MALCLALINAGIPFTALHFNHNLRPEAHAEEAWLRKICAAHGVLFYSEVWSTAPSEGSLQQNARKARYAFFNRASEKLSLGHILIAHTADDVAETALMRLFYGSGVQGLRRMAKKTCKGAYKLHRPLLEFTRGDLRAYLTASKQTWLEDPSNYKPEFVRVRARYWLNRFPPELTEALLEMAEKCTELERALQSHLSPYKDYIIKNQQDWAVINSAVLYLPDYARQRLFQGVFKSLRPGNNLPRTQKQRRLFGVLQEPQSSHTLGHIHFKREGQKVIARPVE